MNVFTESGYRMENLMAVFTQSYKGQYSPLVELNYMVLYGLFGYDPFWFHLTSVVWHCGCATLLFFPVLAKKEIIQLPGTNYLHICVNQDSIYAYNRKRSPNRVIS